MAIKEDAAIVVQIAQWATQMGLQEATTKIFDDDFDPERASANDPDVGKLLGFGEVIGTLVKHELLDRDLVLDLWAVQPAWKRVGPAARRERARLGLAALYENFESLAQPN